MYSDDDIDKANCGKVATFIWIASGIFLFLYTPGANFFSWQSAVYFIPGMFFAAFVFGLTFYLVKKLMVKMLVKTDVKSVPLIISIGYILYAIEIIAIFYTAQSFMKLIT